MALAECCFGADSGASIDISPLRSDCSDLDDWGALFGESLGRILVSVRPPDKEAFQESMKGVCCHYLGTVSDGDTISVSRDGEKVLLGSMSEMRDSWKATLHGGGL